MFADFVLDLDIGPFRCLRFQLDGISISRSPGQELFWINYCTDRLFEWRKLFVLVELDR